MDATSSPSSRFFVLKHAVESPTSEVEGRVTFTTFLVPQQLDNVTTHQMLRDEFMGVFSNFIPRGSEFCRNPWFKFNAVWFSVFEEDRWAEAKFGKLEQAQDNTNRGRAIFCHFYLWSPRYGATPEHEAASAVDPQARESWNQAIARVMPPATAWVQERWDILRVPRYSPPEPEFDPEDPEGEKEHRRLIAEFVEFHRPKVGKGSQ